LAAITQGSRAFFNSIWVGATGDLDIRCKRPRLSIASRLIPSGDQLCSVSTSNPTCSNAWRWLIDRERDAVK
jgi:hypothetical protein